MRQFKLKANELLEQQKMIDKATDNFFSSLHKADSLGVFKAIGVLEHLGAKDLDYFHGIGYQILNNIHQSISSFEKVSPNSKHYQESLYHRITLYSATGNYKELRNTFANPRLEMSYMEKLNTWLRFLYNVDSSLLPELQAKYLPSDFDFSDGDNSTCSSQSFYSVCIQLTNALIIIGDMIDQGSRYLAVNTGTINLETDQNFSHYLSIYNRSVYIFSHCKLVPFLSNLIDDDFESLTLANKPWSEKIRILATTDYRASIMQLIVKISNPELYPTIPQYDVIEHALDQILRIEPRMLSQIVNYYYSTIEQAYINGVKSASQYLQYVYSEIHAYDIDPFNLKTRLVKTLGADFLASSMANEIKLYRSLSLRGYQILRSAEMMFDKINPENCGIQDYSYLSLQYFRVFEVELNEKLIKPLCKIADFSLLKELNEEWLNQNKNTNNAHAEKNRNALDRCINALELCFSKGKPLALGSICKILKYATIPYMRSNPCAIQLYDYISQFLSDVGLDALNNREIQELIESKPRTKYRNPGAHTGFLSYTTAAQAREYVLENLPNLELWFLDLSI